MMMRSSGNDVWVVVVVVFLLDSQSWKLVNCMLIAFIVLSKLSVLYKSPGRK